MNINEIITKVSAINAPAAPARKAAKKPAPPAAVTVAPARQQSDDEILRFNAERIHAAFNLGNQGVTIDMLVAGVKKFESKPFNGVVQ